MTTATTKTEAQFAALYNAHLAAIVNYAARRTSDPDAVDVVAETFAIAWLRLDELPVDNALPWLYGVARRVLANQRRGNLRRHSLHTKLCAEWLPRTSEIVERPEHAPLFTALESLADDDREILLLAGVEELRPIEIATVLNVSAEVVRNRLSRARTRLRTALANVEQGTDS